MLITLIICLCIGRIIHAETSASSPPPFVLDDELTKLAASCITPLEHEQLSGNLIRHFHAQSFTWHLITEAADIIASTEMRAALGFAQPGPWTNYREPSAEELKSVSTVEEYLDLKERTKDRSLDSEYFFEKNFPPVIAFLDKRFPIIRTIYKRKFQEFLLVKEGKIDRKTVDDLIYIYINDIYPKVNRAIYKMLDRKKECG